MDYDNSVPWWAQPFDLLCGNVAHQDGGPSSTSARCNNCGAVVGSISMPQRCKDLYDMEDVIAKLKGKK